jgi:hypothetical protein
MARVKIAKAAHRIEFFITWNSIMNLLSARTLLLTAFFEGGAVMTTELLAARLIAPWYGNSLYVWAGTLGITLSGLAAGYFSGSYFSKKADRERILFTALLVGAACIAIMPIITFHIIPATLSLSLKTGITLSCGALLFIPLLFFGMVSPLAVSCLTSANAGRATGNVYGISTAGGITFTLLTGFLLIPSAGLTITAYISASITSLFPLLFFSKKLLTSVNG